MPPSSATPATTQQPQNLTMKLMWVAYAGEPRQYVFVVNGGPSELAFKTVEGLKEYLKGRPKGSMLTWAPSDARMGDEPLLSGAVEMKKFKEFCESIGIKFTLVPAG